MEDVQRKKNCSLKSKKSGILCAFVCVSRKSVIRSNSVTAKSVSR